MNNTRSRTLLLFLVCSLLLLPLAIPKDVRATTSTSVLYVKPLSNTNVTSTLTVTVNLNLTQGQTINAYDIRFRYDFKVLNATGVTLGNLLGGNGGNILQECINGLSIIGNCSASDVSGIVHLQVVVLGSENATTGPVSKSVFQIPFKVLARGTSPLALINDTLVNANINTTGPYPIPHLTINGVFSNAGLAALINVLSSDLIVGHQVVFDATGTFNPKNTTARYFSILNYTWDFGDGKPRISNVGIPSTSHVYGSPGNYNVSLAVSDQSGSTARTFRVITIVSALGQIQLIIKYTNDTSIASSVAVSLFNGSALVSTVFKQSGSDTVFFSNLTPGPYIVAFAGTTVVSYSKMENVSEAQTTTDKVFLIYKPPVKPDAPNPFDFQTLIVAVIIGAGLSVSALAVLRGRRAKRAARETPRARRR